VVADFLKRVARRTVATAAVGTRLWPVVPKGRAVVLRYHRVAGPPERSGPLSVTAQEFEAQLQFLSRRCHVVSAREIVAAIAELRPLPPRAVAVTFDDGYDDNFTQAFPLLQTYEVPATFFVTAGWIGTEKVLWWDRLHDYIRQAAEAGTRPMGYEDLPAPVAALLARANLRAPGGAARLEAALVIALRELAEPPEQLDELAERIAGALGAGEPDPDRYRPMDWDQVRAMRDAGMEIGSHTISHARLPVAPPERAFEELDGSKQLIERELGEPIALVAYPAGACNQDVLDLACEAAYLGGFTTASGSVGPGDDPFALRRIGVWSGGYRGAFGRISRAVFGLQIGRLARK